MLHNRIQRNRHILILRILLENHGLLLFGRERSNESDLALILSSDDHHAIADAKLRFHVSCFLFKLGFRRHYSTSGASETIFIKFLSRNSRATGPNMRVPRGSLFCGLITTQALSSKRRVEPSCRRTAFLERTMTALITSPFLIGMLGVATLTLATITSPTPPYRGCEPFNTRMHITSRAPELSATFSLENC